MRRSRQAKARPIPLGTVAPDDLDVTWLQIDGERFAVLTHPVQSAAALEMLTPAERDVVALVVSGCSNAEVAARRRTSAHTVANQMAAIFRKLGVGSRRELLGRVAPRSSPKGGLR